MPLQNFRFPPLQGEGQGGMGLKYYHCKISVPTGMVQYPLEKLKCPISSQSFRAAINRHRSEALHYISLNERTESKSCFSFLRSLRQGIFEQSAND
ncbi:MAG: hypothetical protein CSYNP_01724 [Syntrophus sp. SKADARSKE-3]|nr:hypothetical protein [Syntrophus sp. SKADARSKE-3]